MTDQPGGRRPDEGGGGRWSVPTNALGRVRPDAGFLGGLKYGLARLRGMFLGDSRHFPIRMLSLVILVCIALFAMSLYAFLQVEAEAYMESGWLVRGVVGFVTNPWVYSIAVIGSTVVLWVWLADLLASQTAKRTPFSKQTVKRLAAEVKSTDATVRLIGTTDHTMEDLRRKLAYALRHYDEMPDERHDRYDVDVPLEDDDADVGVAGALMGGQRPGRQAAPDGYDDLAAALADGQQAAQAVAHAAAVDDASTSGDLAAAARSTQQQPETGQHTTAADHDGHDGTDDHDDDEWTPPTLRDQVKVLRMDMATAMSWSELARRFLLPAAAVTALSFTVAGSMWLHPLLYVAIAAVSITIGTATYAVTKAQRRRQIRSLRQDRDYEPMNSANTLVKPVDTPEGTGYVAFMGGHVYFDFDRDRFVRKVGRRWHQAINEPAVWPSIQEKFAKRTRQFMPTIKEMEANDPRDGRIAVYNDMGDAIRGAENPDGLIPKRVLGERVVRAGPGIGHDPEVVQQCYRELYGAAWQEVDVMVPDADGDLHEMTMVHLSDHPIQDDVARLLANYSHEFDPHRAATYPLPEVEDDPTVTGHAVPQSVDVTAADPADVVTDPADVEG